MRRLTTREYAVGQADGSHGAFWVRCSCGAITVGAGPLPEELEPADRLTKGVYTPVVPVGRTVNTAMSAEEQEATLDQHRDLQIDLKARGTFATARLMPSNNAVTVKGQAAPGQKPLVVDGPFAETKEQFVGFYLVEYETLEEAIATAERISSPYHSIEIRPVMWSGGTLTEMSPG